MIKQFWKVAIILAVLTTLLVSCGNNRKAQIDLACNKVQDAWDIYIQFRDQIENLNSFSDGDVIRFWSLRFSSKAAAPLNEAGKIFRDLSSQDSGFAQYAAKAFEMAQNDFYRNWSVESLRDLTAYCGTKIEGSGN